MTTFRTERRYRRPPYFAATVAAVAGGVLLAGTATAGPAATGTTVPATSAPAPGFDATVQAAAFLGDTGYLGGAFTAAIQGTTRTPRAHLAAVDGRTGALLPWAPVADGPVQAVATDPARGVVYLAGGFHHIGGVARDGLAAVDATTGVPTGFVHTVTGTVRALATGAGRLYLAGTVTAVDGRPVANVAAFALADGTADTGFAAGADRRVDTLAVAGTRLYLGGTFTRVDGRAGTARLAAVDAATGGPDPGFTPTAPAEVIAVAAGPDGVYAALGGSGGRAIGYGPTGTTRWTETTDGDAQAVAYLAGVVYVGGHFDHACTTTRVATTGGACLDGSVPRGKLLALDAAAGTLLAWNPAANGIAGVATLAVRPGGPTLVAGGTWTTLAGVRQPRFARFTG